MDSSLSKEEKEVGPCIWTDGEQLFDGPHQFENDACSTCGASSGEEV